MSIVFIGAGNLATSLAWTLKQAGHTLLQVYSRTTESAAMLAERLDCTFVTDFQDINPEADVYIYAVRDEVYASLPVFRCKSESVHLLTSGSVPYSALRAGEHHGVIYPFQSFSKQQPISDFSDIPIMIEGEDEFALNCSHNLAASISRGVYESTNESRARLHLAGVLANNFSNCMYALAEEQLQKAGLPFSILLPLIDETARKVHSLSPRVAQTGPASRADKTILEHQLSLLDTEEKKQIYQLISNDIMRHSL